MRMPGMPSTNCGPRERAPLAGVGDEPRAEHPGHELAQSRCMFWVSASLAIDSSGPGSWPALILSIARWFV